MAQYGDQWGYIPESRTKDDITPVADTVTPPIQNPYPQQPPKRERDENAPPPPPPPVPPQAPPGGQPGGSPWDVIGAIAGAFNNALNSFPGAFGIRPPTLFGGQGPMRFDINQPVYAPGYTNAPQSGQIPYGENIANTLSGFRDLTPSGLAARGLQGAGNMAGEAIRGGIANYYNSPEARAAFNNPYTQGLADRLGLDTMRGGMAGNRQIAPDVGIPSGYTGTPSPVTPPFETRETATRGGVPGVPIAGAGVKPEPTTGTGATPPATQPFKYDAGTKTYQFGDGKGGTAQMPEGELQTNLDNSAKKAGISGIELWNFIVNQATTKGGQININGMSGSNLDGVAAAARAAKEKDPNSVKPQTGGGAPAGAGGTGPGGVKLAPESTLPGPGAKEYGAANNRYFQQLAFDKSLDEFTAFRAAVAGGFTGDFESWKITKDQIIHQARGRERGYGGGGGGEGGGGGGTPGVTPPGTTPATGGEPNVRPFGKLVGEVKFDESDIGALPTVYQPIVQQLMQALGYTSTGFMGQYGEKGYTIGSDPKPVTDELLASITSDKTAQAWLKWLAYRKGLLGTVTPYPTG